MQIQIAVDGDVQLNRTLARFTDRIDDASPAFEAMADQIATWEREQFASEGATGSGGWSALNPRYAAWKAIHYPGRGILQRTGRLEASLDQRPFAVEEIGQQQMTVGTDVPYAGFHQRGDGVPQRRPLELRESQRDQLARMLHRYIQVGST